STITRPGDPTWSQANNWQNSVSPQNNDDVVFPTGVPTSEKIDKTSTRQAPPSAYFPLNSSNNLNLTLNSLTISDKDFNIGGNAITLQSDLVGDSNLHGTTAINFDIRLLGNPQSLRVLNSDATLFLGGNLSDASGTSGLIKQGAGTVVLAGNNSFTGLTEVSQGTLAVTSNSGLGDTLNGTTVRDGATLQLSGANVTGEALELVGNGVNGVGALLGGPSLTLSGGSSGVSLSLKSGSGGATWSRPHTPSPRGAHRGAPPPPPTPP